MAASIRKNWFYNTLLTGLNIIFPLLSFPYASRLLGPEGIGSVGFAQSLVNNFIFIACLGIPLYGTREIARVKNDPEQLNRTFSELLLVNICAMLLAFLCYTVLIFMVPRFYEKRVLYFVFAFSLVSSVWSYDWLFRGMENFRFIAGRTAVIKLLSLALLFILVKKPGDYIRYALITVFSQSAANLLNFFAGRKIVRFTFNNLSVYRHLKFIFISFFMGITVKLYGEMDKIMTGLISGEKYVGYYSLAEKAIRLQIAAASSFSAVLLPRMSYFSSMGMADDFSRLIDKSVKFMLLSLLPLAVFTGIFSDQIAILLGGSGFFPAALTLRILSGMLFFSGFANLTGLQVLYASGREKHYLISVAAGMIMALALNFLLIPRYQQNGAALGTLAAEAAGCLIQIIFGWSMLKNSLLQKSNIKYFAALLPAAAAGLYIRFLLVSGILPAFFSSAGMVFSFGISGAGFVYLLALLLVNEPISRGIFRAITCKISIYYN
ncbi:MAG: hypothetical protein A2096_15980 [Spirochaetes bacterium GWF1_41_5]|nr:MAG: hypothetical protein A2096_15980 [Spirochaetes bacterium GWF1_41_5]